ncbi:putative Ig domain-containing protein, partial [uncultured Anaerococcus sp.]|uniref:putative Ig domain-containing protein n=1 Tax=uncultured Anaerococcus sp. TaxID=293428 RepID=UPI00288A2FF3
TDKDGIPDIYDKDDDGDGVPDDVEKEKNTDPKDPNSKPDAEPEKDTTAPKINRIGDQTVIEGKPIADVTVTTDDPKATITVEGLPTGVTYDNDSKKISGTPTVTDWGKDEEKDFTVKVTAEDESGNKSETEFNIKVQRDTDKDGIPDIYDKDDDGDGVSDEDEKKAGTDPKDKDSKPADKKTKVDDSDVNTVNPTNDKQDTGIKVENKDDDTKVSAKDEDGKDIPVEIDNDGKVIVTPGEDVDGPITVTVEDPEIPGGKKDITVPVKDHEKDKDDNNSDTKVDDSGKHPVDPTDEKQGTGVIIKNPDKDTKVSAKDEDGNEVPAVINPETGEIEVTPGTNVDGPITITVEDPDLPGRKVEVEIEVNGHENNRDDNGSDKGGDDDHDLPYTPGYHGDDDDNDDNKTDEDDGKGDTDEDNRTDAEKNPAVDPEKTEVEDPNNLTDEEKTEVADKVKKANPNATDVKVDDKGNVTLVYPDGSMNQIPAYRTVVKKSAPVKVPSKDLDQGPRRDKRGNKLGAKNVKTGVGSASGLLGLLGAAISGLFVTKKKEDEDK